MLSLLIFGFKGNISGEILKDLEIKSDKVLLTNLDSFTDLLNTIQIKNPNYILGLGQYSGKDQKYIKLEICCSNRFRNSPDIPERININSFINPTNQIHLANSIGNSFCNKISYQIMKNHPKHSRYTFLHIPKNFDQKKAKSIIEESLASL